MSIEHWGRGVDGYLRTFSSDLRPWVDNMLLKGCVHTITLPRKECQPEKVFWVLKIQSKLAKIYFSYLKPVAGFIWISEISLSEISISEYPYSIFISEISMINCSYFQETGWDPDFKFTVDTGVFELILRQPFRFCCISRGRQTNVRQRHLRPFAITTAEFLLVLPTLKHILWIFPDLLTGWSGSWI